MEGDLTSEIKFKMETMLEPANSLDVFLVGLGGKKLEQIAML